MSEALKTRDLLKKQ
jgi:hypothetical protein